MNDTFARLRAPLASVLLMGLAASACSPPRPPNPPEMLLLPTRTLAPEPARTQPPPGGPPITAVTVGPASAGPQPAVRLMVCAPQAGPFASIGPLPAGPGQIAFIDPQGNIALADPTAPKIQQVTTDARVSADASTGLAYLFPTFSPDARSIAFVSLNRSLSGFTQTVHVAETRENPRMRALFATSSENIPYLDWAPDNRAVAFLSLNARAGALRLIEADGQNSSVAETGSSLYWHWRSDATALIAHIDGTADSNASARLSLVSRSPIRAERLEAMPGYFEAPQFSPDGQRMLFVARENGDESLVLADASGRPECAVSPVQEALYFAASPDGRRIALIDTPNLLGAPNQLDLIDLGTGKRMAFGRNVLGFFWSPNGRFLATWSVVRDGQVIDPSSIRQPAETPARTNDPPPTPTLKPAVATAQPTLAPRSSSTAGVTSTRRTVAQTVIPTLGTTTPPPPVSISDQVAMRLEIIDVVTGAVFRVADTIPTPDFLRVAQFFDQYSRAVSPWSPDGRSLTFVSVAGDGETSWVYISSMGEDDRIRVRRLTQGTLSFWSPR